MIDLDEAESTFKDLEVILQDESQLGLALCAENKKLRELVGAQKEEPESVDEILLWADGVRSAEGTEYANKITPLESYIANAIYSAWIGYKRQESHHGETAPMSWSEKENSAPR